MGKHLKIISEVKDLSLSRACLFLNCSKDDIYTMYQQPSLDSSTLLRWCKLLDYNFFMIYHTHLQMFTPSAATAKITRNPKDQKIQKSYNFKKNLYSPEIIKWLLEQMESKKMSVAQIIDRYSIPRTTIYRWKKKYANESN